MSWKISHGYHETFLSYSRRNENIDGPLESCKILTRIDGVGV